jgi:hypothetical protein
MTDFGTTDHFAIGLKVRERLAGAMSSGNTFAAVLE